MKIRTGFVSNSSSTSFCICGVVISKSDYDNADAMIGEILDKIAEYNTSPLGGEHIDTYLDQENDEDVYIGISIDAMEPLETRTEFEDRAKRTLKNVMPDIGNVCFHYNGWYEY